MRIIRLEHLDLVVSDIRSSVDFYRKLGFFPDGTNDRGDAVYMSTHHGGLPVGVELHQAKPGQRTGVDHLSFEVEDVDAAFREAKYLGICFEIDPRTGSRSGRRIANFRDPDGVLLQFSRKIERAEYEDWK
jgi:catechol 2,3-dioxygenase-like lactoylglutathione lyase family enzyme